MYIHIAKKPYISSEALENQMWHDTFTCIQYHTWQYQATSYLLPTKTHTSLTSFVTSLTSFVTHLVNW